MGTFKVRVAFKGRRPHQHFPLEIQDPTDTEDLARVFSLNEAIGRLLVIDCVSDRIYADQRWHDAMVAERSPTEFLLQPSRAALLRQHIIYDGSLGNR
jgi:hypothetical protein